MFEGHLSENDQPARAKPVSHWSSYQRAGCFAAMLVFTVLLLLTQGNSELFPIVSVQLEGFSVESESAPSDLRSARSSMDQLLDLMQ